MSHPAVEQLMAVLPPTVHTQLAALGVSPEVFLIASAVLALLVLLVLIRVASPGSGKASRSRSVAIVGPSGSGKTVLFYQLTSSDGSVPATVASMVENDGSCSLRDDAGRPCGAPVRLVDIPGHERLRHKLEGHLSEARAVVFVLDAVEITPHKVEAAEELFEVLTSPSIIRRRVPILLACNKMDLEEQAHSLEFIKRTLEKQLDAMRKTRGALSPEAAVRAAALGKADKPFSLSSLRNPIQCMPISALKGDIKPVHAFLRGAL